MNCSVSNKRYVNTRSATRISEEPVQHICQNTIRPHARSPAYLEKAMQMQQPCISLVGDGALM